MKIMNGIACNLNSIQLENNGTQISEEGNRKFALTIVLKKKLQKNKIHKKHSSIPLFLENQLNRF
jgi:hypothetical protein